VLRVLQGLVEQQLVPLPGLRALQQLQELLPVLQGREQ